MIKNLVSSELKEYFEKLEKPLDFENMVNKIEKNEI